MSESSEYDYEIKLIVRAYGYDSPAEAEEAVRDRMSSVDIDDEDLISVVQLVSVRKAAA